MLKAAQSGKYRGTVLAREGGEARQGLLEDLLTSSVFERIGYLRDDSISSFFDRLTSGARTETADIGAFQSMLFWPQFELHGKRVEPDVVIEFENLVVSIEAKRPLPGVVQSGGQLLVQLEALGHAFRTNDDVPKEVIVMGVGGRRAVLPENQEHVVQLSWRDLWDQLQTIDVDSAGARVIDDIQVALELADVRTKDRSFFRTILRSGLGVHCVFGTRWRTASPLRPMTSIAPVQIRATLTTWKLRHDS